MKEKRLTSVDYDKIPNPGSLTLKFNDGREYQNARSWAYRLAERRGDRIITEGDAKSLRLTITKLGAR